MEQLEQEINSNDVLRTRVQLDYDKLENLCRSLSFLTKDEDSRFLQKMEPEAERTRELLNSLLREIEQIDFLGEPRYIFIMDALKILSKCRSKI